MELKGWEYTGRNLEPSLVNQFYTLSKVFEDKNFGGEQGDFYSQDKTKAVEGMINHLFEYSNVVLIDNISSNEKGEQRN